MPRRICPLLIAFAACLGAGPARAQFTDVTSSSHVGKIVSDRYTAYPDWWLSGLHFVDLDGDGNLDLILSSHGGADALALLNDGHGVFTVAAGSYPATEIHLNYDIDEDGRNDLSMTYTDGGSEWWRNLSTPGTLNMRHDVRRHRQRWRSRHRRLREHQRTVPDQGLSQRQSGAQLAARPADRARRQSRCGRRKDPLYAAGTKQLIGFESIAIYCFQAASSYYGRAQRERHFGLGSRANVDVEVEFYPSGRIVRRATVGANQAITINEDDELIFTDGFESAGP